MKRNIIEENSLRWKSGSEEGACSAFLNEEEIQCPEKITTMM
jgi:hypothetical protein